MRCVVTLVGRRAIAAIATSERAEILVCSREAWWIFEASAGPGTKQGAASSWLLVADQLSLSTVEPGWLES